MNVELIAAITGLPSTGMDPAPLLKKDQEAAIAKQMKESLAFKEVNEGF